MDQRSKATLYRQLAAECARGAGTALEARIKDAYLELERRWLQLAEEAERLEERRRATGE